MPLFTPSERGRVKHVFSKRKVFWDKISTMVLQAGMLADVAIDKVYAAYGENQSGTNSLRQMQRDKGTVGVVTLS